MEVGVSMIGTGVTAAVESACIVGLWAASVAVGLGVVFPLLPKEGVARAKVGTFVASCVGINVAAVPPVPDPYPNEARQVSSRPSVSKL